MSMSMKAVIIMRKDRILWKEVRDRKYEMIPAREQEIAMNTG